MTTEYVTLNQVTHDYGRGRHAKTALTEVTFVVPQGQFVAVVGPSGAGKTTLLGVLGGTLRPSAGQVIVGGTQVDRLSEAELALYRRHTVGMVFQHPHLFAELTALENVLLPLGPARTRIGREQDRAREVLNQVGMGEKAGVEALRLDTGEALRVAVARALVQDPELMLVDDIASGVDADQASWLMELLRRLNNEGKTVMVTGHDASHAPTADRILRLKAGAIVGDQTEGESGR